MLSLPSKVRIFETTQVLARLTVVFPVLDHRTTKFSVPRFMRTTYIVSLTRYESTTRAPFIHEATSL